MTKARTDSGPEQVLADARAAGVQLWVEGGRLKFRAPGDGLPPELRDRIRNGRDDIVGLLRSEAERRIDTGPLAANQLGLWFLSRVAAQSAAYNMAFASRIWGGVDTQAMRDALQGVVDRHETLRTCYPLVDGSPARRVAGYAEAELGIVDARDLSREELQRRIETDYAIPFDLETGPVYRVVIYRDGADSHVMLVAVHHIMADATALFVLLEELFERYTSIARAELLPIYEDSASFSEFVEWQRNMLERAGEDKAYWNGVLTPPPPSLGLPTDRPRSLLPEMHGDSIWMLLEPELAQKLSDLARQEGVTDYVLLMSLWFAFLHRLTGQTDITVGTPVLGRPSKRFARTVGTLINLLPFRVKSIGGISFRELLPLVRDVVAEGLKRQDYALPLMVEDQGRRDAYGRPPFDTLFVLQDFSRFSRFERLLRGDGEDRVEIGALTMSRFVLDQQEGQSELSLDIYPQDDGLACLWRFDDSVLDAATVTEWSRSFVAMTQEILSSPNEVLSEIALVDADSAQELATRWNRSEQSYPVESSFPDLFVDRAGEFGDRNAACHEGSELTFAELDRRSARLARRLVAQGAETGSLIPLLVDRGFDMLTGMLGIMRAGGAYVPLDPAFPPERLRYMLEDCRAAMVVTHSSLAGESFSQSGLTRICLDREEDLAGADPNTLLPESIAPDSVAYVIYTSGSTGRPKGVEVEHRALLNFLFSMAREPGLGESDVLAAITTISFDIAGLELLLPLLTGARIEIIGRDAAVDPMALADRLAAAGVTVLQATPSSWRMLLESGWQGLPGLRALCGGEAMDRELAQRLLSICGELWNMYGPTETTVWSSVARISDPDAITIGRPIANTRLYVLDDNRNLVPRGAIGELWIGGDGVARGYLNQPELTAERFTPNPYHDGRMYRTGDLARQMPDGRIRCLGRADGQIKLRGYRIELGEIEAALANCPGIAECAVIVRGEARNQRLVAFFVGQADAESLKSALRRTLPEYMVPSAFHSLDRLPRTPNGKIDRNALPETQPVAPPVTGSRFAPVTRLEIAIAALWEQLLDVSSIGRDDSFFDLGGNSLQAATFVTRFEKAEGIRVNPAELIYQTLRQLASVCEERSGVASGLRADEVLPAAVPARRDRDVYFFGPYQSSLLGVFHPAGSARIDREVLVCQPIGQEYMRSHRACTQLSCRLARRGMPVLRFDYFGTGDSAGSHTEVRLDRWVDDVESAATHLAARVEASRLCLIGLRWGGTLATLFAARQGAVDQLVLWNPAVDGSAYCRELDAMHRDMLRRSYVRRPQQTSDAMEILGYPFPGKLLEDFESVNLMKVDRAPAPRVLLIDSAGDDSLSLFGAHLRRLGADVVERQYKGPMLWLEEPFKEVVPTDIWDEIEQQLAGSAS